MTVSRQAEIFTVVGTDGVGRYRLDGSPVDTALPAAPCSMNVRRTIAEERNGQVVITESIVALPAGSRTQSHTGPCLFGTDDEEDGSAPRPVAGSALLDAITVVSRQGDRLFVEITRRGPTGPVTTTTTYQPAAK